MEESIKEESDGNYIRDCYGKEYVQPLAIKNSKVLHAIVAFQLLIF